MASTHKHRIPLILTFILLFLAPMPIEPDTLPDQSPAHALPGCTTLYAYDGDTALAGNNEDLNNPLTLVWFIPASQGRFGRVYFGYDDYIPQGGLNDQGVFFDGLALTYKAMPVMSQRPQFTGGDMAYMDEILSRSANVQDAIDITGRWNRVGGEYGQNLIGDRFGDSVIIDGDTVLRKQGAFQLATNFRLVENPNPPYPEERYGTLYDMLSTADHYDVELFRQALDAAHAEGDYPTIYSQIYNLKTGTIYLYLYHNFQQEVVLNLADELAKGPHTATIASLFPKNNDFILWAFHQEKQWKEDYEQGINSRIKPSSQSWMSGEYVLQEEAEAGPVKFYMENDQLYMQKPNQFPIELYPTAANAVYHHFYNGLDLNLTFQRNLWGQVTEAEGDLSFQPYNISLPYHLTRAGALSSDTSLQITLAGVSILLISLGSILYVVRKRRSANRIPSTPNPSDAPI